MEYIFNLFKALQANDKSIIAIIIGIFVIVILSSLIYRFKNYLKIITKEIPKFMESAEKAFPDGHGEFKLDYVLQAIKNICNEKKIHFNKKFFNFVVNLIVNLSKIINIKSEKEVEKEDQ